MTTPTRSRRPTLDAVCAAATDEARAAAEASAPGEVGEHLDVESDDERVVTHRFACLNPGYVGWHWAVTVNRASRAKDVTVAEIVLLPGSGAVLAPAWLPWNERLRPGDLGPGDILPTPEEDDRLVPGYTGASDGSFDPADGGPYDETAVGLVAAELGLDRARVLSPLGRDDAIDRWYTGERGPDAPIATAAPAHCGTCGFLAPMAGSVGRVFGVCANEWAPDDARVVSFDHGCGAHSEALTIVPGLAERAEPVLDEIDYDLVESGAGAEAVRIAAAAADPDAAPLADVPPADLPDDVVADAGAEAAAEDAVTADGVTADGVTADVDIEDALEAAVEEPAVEDAADQDS